MKKVITIGLAIIATITAEIMIGVLVFASLVINYLCYATAQRDDIRLEVTDTGDLVEVEEMD